jgi:tetratricopeptide (TPR) repeat protein
VRELAGRWVLEEELGRGGMGVVHRARDARTGERAALKLLLPWASRDLELRARFERETKAARAVSDPRVVRLLDSGEEGGEPFVVFELATGGSLAERVGREGPLPGREVAELGARIARGLAAIHAAGLVHRDVKPANILLAKDGAKVSDLGLARWAPGLDESGSLTATGVVVGTPAYLSPEQANAGPVSPRADLYGLGGVLYFALTGSAPFQGGVPAVIEKQLTARPVPPGRLRAGVPRDLERLVLRLLEKDPSARGRDAASVAAELEAIARGRAGRSPLLLLGALGALAGLGALAVFLLSLLAGGEPGPLPAPHLLPAGPRALPFAPRAAAPVATISSASLDELAAIGSRVTSAYDAHEDLGPLLSTGAALASRALDGLDRLAPLEGERAFAGVGRFLDAVSKAARSPDQLDAPEALSRRLLAASRTERDERGVLAVRMVILFRRERYAEAFEACERLRRLRYIPESVLWIAARSCAGLGLLEAARRILEELPPKADIEDEVKETARGVELRAEAERLKRAGDRDGALAAIEKAIDLVPDDGESYNIRGGLRNDQGDVQGAIADYSRCYERRSPSAAPAVTNRGLLRLRAGDRDGARGDYERAIALDPDYDQAYANLGFLLLDKDPRAAAAALETALRKRHVDRDEEWVKSVAKALDRATRGATPAAR